MKPVAYVIGTFDTKSTELDYVDGLLKTAGVDTILVDVGTRSNGSIADVKAIEVASHHPDGPSAVFSDDRGKSIAAMSLALREFMRSRKDVGGIIGLGGSGGSSLIAPSMQTLPIGIPKVLVSTLASGDVSAYVGASDVNVFHPVADISGLNRVTRKVLANAAHALAGMMTMAVPEDDDARKPIALSMFGVTTPAVQAMTAALEDTFDCLVFHATGTGGRSMEQLIDQGDIDGVLDITTTEVCDLLCGGVLSAGEERLDSIARRKLPYVGSCGALDMINFWGIDSLPEHIKGRNIYQHNAQVTLVRTTAEENAKIGTWIGKKLNACEGPVRFLLPLKGVSALDAEGQQFHDPAANQALFDALQDTVIETDNRKLVPLDLHINDPEFAKQAVTIFNALIS